MKRHLIETHCVPTEIATPLAMNIKDLANIQRGRRVATYSEDPTDLLPSTDPQCSDLKELLSQFNLLYGKTHYAASSATASRLHQQQQQQSGTVTAAISLPVPPATSSQLILSKVSLKKSSLRQGESATRRLVSQCPLPSCGNSVVVASKIRTHVIKTHKPLKAVEREDAITVMRSRMKMCDLVGPVGQGGKKLKDLLAVKDAFSLPYDDSGLVNDGTPEVKEELERIKRLTGLPQHQHLLEDGSNVRAKSNSAAYVLHKWANTDCFKQSHPCLSKIIEEYDEFLRVKHPQAHIRRPIARNTKYIFLLRAADLGRDMTMDDLTDLLKHSSMVNHFRDFTGEGVLQNATRAKYLSLFKNNFCDFLLQTQRMNHSTLLYLGDTYKNVIKTIRDDIVNKDIFRQNRKASMQKNITSDDLDAFRDSSHVRDWLKIVDDFADSSGIGPHDLAKTSKHQYAPTESGSAATELRNLLMTLLIIKSGRRTKEICTMRFDALESCKKLTNKDGTRIFFFETDEHKTGKDMTCYFHADLTLFNALNFYRTYYRPTITNDARPNSPLFPNKCVTSVRATRLSYTRVNRIIRHCFAKKAGVPVPYYFGTRDIRKALHGKNYLLGNRGVNLDHLARLMCHSSTTAVKHYQLPTNDYLLKLAEAADKLYATRLPKGDGIGKGRKKTLAATVAGPSSNPAMSVSSDEDEEDDYDYQINQNDFDTEDSDCSGEN